MTLALAIAINFLSQLINRQECFPKLKSRVAPFSAIGWRDRNRHESQNCL